MNIQDPMCPTNNLGKSVSEGNLYRIVSVFKYFREILNVKGIDGIFNDTFEQAKLAP